MPIFEDVRACQCYHLVPSKGLFPSCKLGFHVQISKKLACGDVGNGALAEPHAIADAVREAVKPVK